MNRNQPCHCGSGKKYKKCHERIDEFYRTLPVLPKGTKEHFYVGTYADFGYLYPPQPNTRVILSVEIAKYDLDDFLQTVAKINFMSAGGYGFTGNNDLEVLKTIAQDEVYNRAYLLKKKGIVKQLLVHHQVVALIIENLLLEKSTANIRVSDNVIKDVRKCLFRMSDFLENDLYQIGTKQVTDIEIAVGSLFRNMYFNSGVPFEHLIGRYYAIFFKYFPKAIRKFSGQEYNFARAFKEKMGIDLKIYMVVAFQLWGYFSNKSLEEKSQFLRTPGHFVLNRELKKYKIKFREEAQKAFDVFSKNREWFKKNLEKNVNGSKFNYYMIEALLKSPIFKLPNGNYFPLDLHLFEHKVTVGVKWDIHDCIRDAIDEAADADSKEKLKKERQALMAFYGRPIELYVTDILKAIAKKQGSTIFISNEKDTGGIDFILYDKKRPDSIVFIELTTSWIHYTTAMSGDIKRILTEFTDRFVLKGKNRSQKGKIKQLHDSIQYFNKGKSSRLAKLKNKISKIYPVLMTETGFPQFPGLTQRYKKIISDHGLLDTHIANFQFVDIEELELIEPLIGKNEEDFRLIDLFEKHLTLPQNMSGWSFKNFLHMNKMLNKNPRMFGLFKGILYDAERIIEMDFKERIKIFGEKIRRFISTLKKSKKRNK